MQLLMAKATCTTQPRLHWWYAKAGVQCQIPAWQVLQGSNWPGTFTRFKLLPESHQCQSSSR